MSLLGRTITMVCDDADNNVWRCARAGEDGCTGVVVDDSGAPVLVRITRADGDTVLTGVMPEAFEAETRTKQGKTNAV